MRQIEDGEMRMIFPSHTQNDTQIQTHTQQTHNCLLFFSDACKCGGEERIYAGEGVKGGGVEGGGGGRQGREGWGGGVVWWCGEVAGRQCVVWQAGSMAKSKRKHATEMRGD